MRSWKKLGLYIILLASLAACQKTKKPHWLTGKWTIPQWNLTFEWTYKENTLCVKQPADKQGTWKLKEQKGSHWSHYLFEASDGTQYHITKIDDTNIKFYQSAKKGQLGLTQAVAAIKNP